MLNMTVVNASEMIYRPCEKMGFLMKKRIKERNGVKTSQGNEANMLNVSSQFYMSLIIHQLHALLYTGSGC